MSNSTDPPLFDRTARPGSPVEGLDWRRLVATPVSALAFWSAIALPALYLPLLAAGIDSTEGLVLFLGLFALHVASLVAGRSHRR